jgi:hypothetical protein
MERIMDRRDEPAKRPEDEVPATNLGETTGSAVPDAIGRDGDTIVQDSVTTGRPLEGEDRDPVDRRAP